VKNMDVLLRTGLVESSNRLDEYAETIDSLKITPYGYYMINTICYMFNYIDLVCLDCGIHEQSVAHSLGLLADKDIDLFFKGKKLDRVKIRLRRAQEFVDYIVREEEKESDIYGLDGTEAKFGKILQERLTLEKVEILQSAEKNYKDVL
ncbi:MAG: hypothetical protein C0392_06875, partial [Syntrophus sp. (in: bacteria)]|nr:hypothetical protein [Syntrophus sp. (in: bacteria)]